MTKRLTKRTRIAALMLLVGLAGPACLPLADPPNPVVQMASANGCEGGRMNLVLPEGLVVSGLVAFECVEIALARAEGATAVCAASGAASEPARYALPGEVVGCSRVAAILP